MAIPPSVRLIYANDMQISLLIRHPVLQLIRMGCFYSLVFANEVCRKGSE